MAYSINNVSTAGKVSVFACVLGLLSFAFIFTWNMSQGTFNTVEAQDVATTTVTVLNTPPQWTVGAQEATPSTTTSPTNAGNVISWTAVGTDSNSEPYYLLICKTNASATPLAGQAPRCDVSTNQWAVSTSTVSGSQATAATTTQAAWAESNDWYAWICDDNATNPRCNAQVQQGSGNTASPFEVNHRPLFSVHTNTSPTLPGQQVTFMSTSSDTDVSGSNDTVMLIVCNLNDFSTSTDQCGPGGMIASSTFVSADASAVYTITIPTQDQNYSAYGFVIDNHGFESAGVAQGSSTVLTVLNATPTVASSTISINNSVTMTPTVESATTSGFTMQFTVNDNNSCYTAASTSEIVNYELSLYRSGIGSTTCALGNAGLFNANNCYTSAAAFTTWQLTCTASTTSCVDNTDPTVIYTCSFPLWYIADPTDGTSTSTQYSTENWLAQVRAVDDDNATSTASQSQSGTEVGSFLAFDLNNLTIPYGSLEPNTETPTLVATTTIRATGNVGLDQRLQGTAMCINYATGNPCPNSATSTIAAEEQVYATSTVTYAQGVALSSTTAVELELNVQKSTSTTEQATGRTYWGIRVPSSITLAGAYKGENTFIAITGESVNW